MLNNLKTAYPQMHSLLLLAHIVCFALWFGAVAASALVIRVLQPRLTDPDSGARDAELLRAYIRLEVKLVDVAFFGVAFFGVFISGVLLAQFFVGWSSWTFVKLSLYLAQFAATMLYIAKQIRPLAYPCSSAAYRRWYGVFALSLVGLIAIGFVWLSRR